MSQADRVEVLKSKHARLEEALEDEIGRPRPDDAAIAQLKREKLRVKDELARLSDS